MNYCPCCSRPEPLHIVPDGIWHDPMTDAPIAIAYRCSCGTNRSKLWEKATPGERIEANLAELTRDEYSKMMGRR